MVVGVLRVEIHLPYVHSLKEKRSVVRRILGRCRERFPISCSEVGKHDLWQRAELGFTAVFADAEPFSQLFERIENEIITSAEIEICTRDEELIRY